VKLSRPARIALSAWVVSLLSYSLAQACTPAPPAIQVKCSNTEVPILAPEDAHKKLSDIAALCNENLAPVISTFEQRIAESFRISRLLLLRRELTLEPYSLAREAQIQKGNRNLLSCSYKDLERVGQWLIVQVKGRPYCHELAYFTTCPTIFFSLSRFLFFLTLNPNLTTLPYLTGFLASIILVTGLWHQYLKRRPTTSRRGVIIESMVLLPLALLLIAIPIGLIAQVIGWAIGCYLLARWRTQAASAQQTASA